MIALTAVFVLLIAPIVVILTHGPAAHISSAEMTADCATHSHGHSHGHSHDHGHGHGHGHGHDDLDGDIWGGSFAGGLFAGHDATDHDHQLQALTCSSMGTWDIIAHAAPSESAAAFRGRTQDEPRRPPRPV